VEEVERGDEALECLAPGNPAGADTPGGDEQRARGPDGDGRAVEFADLGGRYGRGFGVALALDGDQFVAVEGEEVDAVVAALAVVFDEPAIAGEPGGDGAFESGGIEGAEGVEGVAPAVEAEGVGKADRSPGSEDGEDSDASGAEPGGVEPGEERAGGHRCWDETCHNVEYNVKGPEGFSVPTAGSGIAKSLQKMC
jgi:hypothetical protein